MNIIAHDLPIDEKPDFYKEKAAKELADYPIQGSDDREKSYFLKMFLSCYRACGTSTASTPGSSGSRTSARAG